MGGFASKPAAASEITLTTAPAPSSGGFGSTAISVVGGLLLLYVAYLFYNYIQRSNGFDGITAPWETTPSSGDKTPTPIDGKVRTVIPSGEVPSTGGADWGLQYWMYISDWNYKFGANKDVVKRVGVGPPPTAPGNLRLMSELRTFFERQRNANTVGPAVSLSPSENTLNVRLSVFPADNRAGAAAPGASTTGDSFNCNVENVPLQSWFSVSITCFQRNMDIYINGRLVKSCVLPGVPRPAVGDIIIADAGGFSGSVCNLHWYNSMLSPADAKEFHGKGTQCAPPAEAGTAKVDEDSLFITLFGYTFRFSTLDKRGKELSGYTF